MAGREILLINTINTLYLFSLTTKKFLHNLYQKLAVSYTETDGEIK